MKHLLALCALTALAIGPVYAKEDEKPEKKDRKAEREERLKKKEAEEVTYLATISSPTDELDADKVKTLLNVNLKSGRCTGVATEDKKLIATIVANVKSRIGRSEVARALKDEKNYKVEDVEEDKGEKKDKKDDDKKESKKGDDTEKEGASKEEASKKEAKAGDKKEKEKEKE